jgi:hypothetical protein
MILFTKKGKFVKAKAFTSPEISSVFILLSNVKMSLSTLSRYRGE